MKVGMAYVGIYILMHLKEEQSRHGLQINGFGLLVMCDHCFGLRSFITLCLNIDYH